LDWIGSLPGKRENVRYVGDHILTQMASTGDAEILRNGVERDLAGVDHGWWGSSGDMVTYIWSVPVSIKRVRLVLDSDFNRNIIGGVW